MNKVRQSRNRLITFAGIQLIIFVVMLSVSDMKSGLTQLMFGLMAVGILCITGAAIFIERLIRK